MQAEAGPAGCEPRGFGWSATVEVCSARVTRLVTDQEKPEKFPGAKLVPGTGLAPDVWTRFASIPTRGSQRCLAPGWGADLLASGLVAAGAWHRTCGRDLPAFRLGDCKGAWHRVGGLICKHPGTVAKVPGTGWQHRVAARMALYCLDEGARSSAADGYRTGTWHAFCAQTQRDLGLG